MYIAHISEDEKLQSVQEHSQNCAKLSSSFSVAPLKELTYILGLIHDIGKYQSSFQQRLKDKTIRAPHSLCGAKEAKKLFGSSAPSMILQYAIAGHHGGLPDCGTKADGCDTSGLYATLQRECESYDAYKDELTIPQLAAKELSAFLGNGCRNSEEAAERFAFFTRYCFSCLTDADWLDTESFCTGTERQKLSADFHKCLMTVNSALQGFECKTSLQGARAGLQAQVFEKTKEAANIYLMNMPTGSGKTLASIKFALERAIRTGKRRIIYIIPFNSIIDQTADTLERILGEHADILRHQSTFDFESIKGADEQDALALKKATENWDAQIILTTAVQFFESVYSNKRSKLRKLHNMADSILVFDEAHLMPQNYLQPCFQAVTHITKFLNSEAVFLTATMPNYKMLFAELSEQNLEIKDLVQDKKDFGCFAKCSYSLMGEVSDEELISSCTAVPSALVVVNNRKAAAKLYNMAMQGKRFHLSTYMTAKDRARVISEVKEELYQLEKDYPTLENVPLERRVILVSTSLIEAGVDLDFSTVFRQLWGLDSILQTGGRCNREGKRKNARVFVFERLDDRGRKLTLSQSITKGLCAEFEDISSETCINEYYERLYFVRRDELCKNALGKQCPKPMQIPFRSYAEKFEIIDSNIKAVAIEQDEQSKELIERLKNTGITDTRKLQSYTFSIYENELDLLMRLGVCENLGGVYCLTNKDYYNKNTGVCFDGIDYIT